MRPFWKAFGLTAWALAAVSCSGGGGGAVTAECSPSQAGTEHLADISWAPNRESGVNAPSGGYRVEISGKAPIDVPYVSGPMAPTSVSTTLRTGCYRVTVRAYAALDAQGGTTGSVSPPSKTLVVHVP